MRTLAIHVRPGRHEGRPSDVASLLSANSAYTPWKHDLPRQLGPDIEDHTMNQPPFPTVVEVHREEQPTSRSRSGEPHHQTKTFAELQRALIQNELVGAAADRARLLDRGGQRGVLSDDRFVDNLIDMVIGAMTTPHGGD